MPRKSRTRIIKSWRRRTQKSKVLRSVLVADAVTLRTFNPKADERGFSKVTEAWINLLLIIVISIMATILLVAWFAPPADAKAVQVEPVIPKSAEQCRPDPVTYIERVNRRWWFVELCDGSAWMVTRCRHEDSNNCWWNAERRGNGEGRSFVVLRRHYHLTNRWTVGP